MPVWTILAFDLTPLQLLTDCLPLKSFDSHRQVASGSVDFTILDNSTLWLTVSNAAVSSTATHTVRCGGFLWLKHVAISVVDSNDLSLHEVELSGNYRCQQIEINSYPDSPLFISTGFLPRVSSMRMN